MDNNYSANFQFISIGKYATDSDHSLIYLFDFLKYEWKNRHYFIVFCLFLPAILMASTMFSETLAEDSAFFVLIGLLNIVTMALTLSRRGENYLCSMLGGKKILREEHEMYLLMPFTEVVEKCRRDGLDLPEEITPFVVPSEAPFAVAVGRHTVLLSEGMMELNDTAFQTVVENQLFRIHKRVPDLIRAVFGSNLVTVFVLIPIVFFLHIEKKHGGYRVDIFGSIHSDSRDAAIILFLVTGTVLCACVLWISLISSASKEPIFEADEYGCRCGHGEYLICYLDNMDDYNLPLMFELAKCIVPGKDQRISRIQRMCAA